MLMQRRKLLALAGLSALPGSAAIAGMPTQLLAPHNVGATPEAIVQRNAQPCLVHIMLKGGNDGMNTLIPIADPYYRRLRPSIALKPDEVLPLERSLALHPALKPLMKSWHAGELAVFPKVQAHTRASHYAGRMAWYNHNPGDTKGTGWIARAVKNSRSSGTTSGLVIGEEAGPLASDLVGNVHLSIADDGLCHDHSAVLHIESQSGISTGRIMHTYQSIPKGIFPSTQLGRELQLAAGAIMTGKQPAAIHITHDGYDTHSDQRQKHDDLLRDLAQSLAAFRFTLLQTGHWSKVAVLTGSEFGRSMHENRIGGTDHGDQTCHFMMGGQVNGGLMGNYLPLGQINTQGDSALTPHDVRREALGWMRSVTTRRYSNSALAV